MKVVSSFLAMQSSTAGTIAIKLNIISRAILAAAAVLVVGT